MEVSNRGEAEVQAALFKAEVHGEKTNVGKFRVEFTLGGESKVQNRDSEAKVHGWKLCWLN